jgi:hypothetical protein
LTPSGPTNSFREEGLVPATPGLRACETNTPPTTAPETVARPSGLRRNLTLKSMERLAERIEDEPLSLLIEQRP